MKKRRRQVRSPLRTSQKLLIFQVNITNYSVSFLYGPSVWCETFWLLKCYFQRFKAIAGILTSVTVLMYFLNYSLPEGTETILYTVEVSQVFIHKHTWEPTGEQKGSDQGEMFSFSIQRHYQNTPLTPVPRMTKGHSWVAWVFHTVCSLMLSMNDSSWGQLYRILVKRKGKSYNLHRMSVLVWERVSNAVLEVTCPGRSQGAGVRLCDSRNRHRTNMGRCVNCSVPQFLTFKAGKLMPILHMRKIMCELRSTIIY